MWFIGWSQANELLWGPELTYSLFVIITIASIMSSYSLDLKANKPVDRFGTIFYAQ